MVCQNLTGMTYLQLKNEQLRLPDAYLVLSYLIATVLDNLKKLDSKCQS